MAELFIRFRAPTATGPFRLRVTERRVRFRILGCGDRGSNPADWSHISHEIACSRCP